MVKKARQRHLKSSEKNDEKNDILLNYFNEISKEFRSQTKTVREELDEHLAAINETTDEIQSNYELMLQLDSKLNKLQERMDHLQMFVENQFGISKSREEKRDYREYNLLPLTKNEQEVFLSLYAADSLSYHDIARQLSITEALAQNYIGNLISKGIPVLKRYHCSKTFISIDKAFKDLHAKRNIIAVSPDVARMALSR